MSNYKISIIIPTFNIEKDLERAIKSLITQTIGFKNIEVVIVDDCSTDGTRNLILDYANKYDNIKYIFLETNSGSAGKPRNIGITHASADYIMFLDNDDEYVDEACEILYNKIKETNSNVLLSLKVNNLYKSTDQIPEINETPEFKEVNILEEPEYLFYPHSEYSGAMWSKIFKKDFLMENDIKCLENLPEDVYFMHKCYYLNPNLILLTNLNLYNHYFYRTDGQSITVTLSYSFLYKAFLAYDKLKELKNDFNNTTKFFNAYNNLFFEVLASFIIASDATNSEKLSLIETYHNALPTSTLKFRSKILYCWYKLARTNQKKLLLGYTICLNFLMHLKRKIIN